MRQYCNCEWNDKAAVVSLCAAHQHYETKRCSGFMRDVDVLREGLRQSLRQWNMYAEQEEGRDLQTEPSVEGDMYRAHLALTQQ